MRVIWLVPCLYLQRLASYRPYPIFLIKLAILQANDNQWVQAEETLNNAVVYYPSYVPGYFEMIASVDTAQMTRLKSILNGILVASDV